MRHKLIYEVLRIIGFAIGIILLLGLYAAFVLPLHPIAFLYMIFGVILMSVYSWLIVSKFRRSYSVSSTIGQLCVSFLLATRISINPNDNVVPGAVTIKMVVALLAIYIVLKIRDRNKSDQKK